MKNLNKKIKEAVEDLKVRGWFKNEKKEIIALNLVYMLAKNNYLGAEETAEDLAETFENLIINNEIITAENASEYDLKKLAVKNHTTEKTILNNLSKNKGYLLNYYRSSCDLVNCFIKFNADFDQVSAIIAD